MKFGKLPPRRLDYTGQKSDWLTVVGFAYVYGKHTYWHCRCRCGTETVVAASHLHGHTKSCGCRPNKRGYKHGASRSVEWAVWKSMKQRCFNVNSASYPDYGGRGITVCDRWMKFENFLKDMGRRPAGPERLTLERVNNDGNYEPSNCRWATYHEQSLNRRERQPSPELRRAIPERRNYSMVTSDGLLY